MCNVQRVVGVDVAVGDLLDAIEDVVLQGFGRFHYEGVRV